MNFIKSMLAVLAIVVTLFTVAIIGRAEAGPRPSNSSDFDLQRNGVPVMPRPLNDGGAPFGSADGGGLTLVTYDAGIGCADVLGGKLHRMDCDSHGYFCTNPDGGCSSLIGDPNFGLPFSLTVPAAAGVTPFVFMTPATSTYNSFTRVCVTPITASDATIICAIAQMQ